MFQRCAPLFQFALGLSALALPALPTARADAAPAGSLLPPLADDRAWPFSATSPAQATVSHEGDALKITITAAGTDNWQMQLARGKGDLDEGRQYTLRLRAKADPPREVAALGSVDKPDTPYFLAQVVSVTSEWKVYTLTFTAKGVAPGRVTAPSFQFGKGPAGTLWLSDVTLTAGLPQTRLETAPVGPDLWPRAGETLLEGTVRETDPARKRLVMLAVRSIAPDGAAEDVAPPRAKVVTLRTALAVRPGGRVAVVGQNGGLGKPLAARVARAAPIGAPGAYTLVDIGTIADGDQSATFALNNAGQVASYANIAAGSEAFHVTLYDAGRLIDLGTLGGPVSEALSVNDRGQVSGMATIPSGEQHAFLWENGKMTDLGEAGSTSLGWAINGRGDVAGSVAKGEDASVAFLSHGGRTTLLGTLPDRVAAEAHGINDRGEVVGTSWNPNSWREAFLYGGGKMRGLGTLPGGSSSGALGINARGQVTGFASTSSGAMHAFLYSKGRMTDLGTMGAFAQGRGINSAGDVVGDGRTTRGARHAGLFRGGHVFDLNDGLPPDSGWELQTADAINDKGQIIGLARHDGKKRGYLLTPR